MSINGLQNTNLIINTIDGLTNIWATDIYENGQKLSVAGLVPYTGANQMVDLNNQTIRTTHTPSNNADLINLETLTNAVTFVDNSVSLTYLNKITTTPQTVDGKVTFNKELAVINNKKTNLSSKLVVDSNYKSNLTSGSITTTQGLGTITNVGIVYQVSTTSTNPGILNLFPIIAGTRYRFSIELLGGFGSTTTYLQTSQSEDGINPYTSGIIDVRIFPNGSTDYETLDYTFEALTNGYVIIEISTDDPSGITGLKWKNFTTYNMGVYLDNITTTITASKVPIINDKQQLVSSGVDSIKITYLDNVSSDIQTQLNNKVDISTLSDYALLAGNNTFTGNNQFQNGNTTTTGITSFKNNSACDIDKGYELNAAFQTSTFTRRLGRISFLRNAGGTDYSGYMGLDVSTDGALYKRMLTLHKDNGVSAGANKITTTYTAVNNEDVVNKGSLNTVLGSYLTVINAAATYATIATVNNKADTFYVDVQDGLRVLKTGDTMSGDLTVNGTVLAYTLNSNAWARFEDYREGMSPFNQPSASMGYYFGTHNNNDTTPYSDLLCLNGWFDGSGGNVNLISFNKGGKGIRQFQGTHGSKSAFSTYYDCVMTEENSSNVTLGGKLITGGTIVIKNNVNSYEPGCIYTDVNWGMLFRGAVVPNIAHMRWDASDGTTLMKIQNTGVLSFTGGGTNYAVENNLTTRAGALCIGNISTNYGGGWQSGLMMECQDTTEISCHDSGNRLTSFIYYNGANRLYIGRDIGWGATPITLSGSVNIDSTAQISTGANQNFLTLYATSNNSLEYINLRFSHQGNSSYIQSYRPSGFWRVYLRFYTVNNAGTSIEMLQITDGGIQCYGSFYTAGNAWCGDWTRVGNGCADFSQNWDRCLIYANGANTAGGYFYYNQNNAYGTISDRRIKKDFEIISENQSITFIKALEPTSFCLKEQKPTTRKRINENGEEIEEEITPAVCSCRQDGWIAQNVLEACEISGASKSVVNNWYDYQQELNKPEEEQKTLIGVSDRPILSHTVNVVKHLLNENETLKEEIKQLKDIIYQHNELLKKISERLK